MNVDWAFVSNFVNRLQAVLGGSVFFSLAWTLAATQPYQADGPYFSGTWTLDLRASITLEPVLKEVGAV